MAANRTITSVNTKLSLIFSNSWANTTATDALGGVSQTAGMALNAVSSLIGVPLELECLTSDNPFSFTQQTVAETQSSIEGKLYGGYLATASNIELTTTFIAASDSLTTIQAIVTIMKTQRETMNVNGTMIIPSLHKTFALNDGFLIDYQAIPSHGKTLENVKCTWRFTSATETSS